MNKSLLSNTAKFTVLAKAAQEVVEYAGVDAYMNSWWRREHITGQGFFGVSNTGSTDCAKERGRGITDSFGYTHRTPEAIPFRSASTLGLTSFDCRNIHRVEHTVELNELVREFEAEYIITGRDFDCYTVAEFFITRMVIVLIEQVEQKSKSEIGELPFSKYSNRVFYDGMDISDATHEDLAKINMGLHAELLNNLANFDWSKELAKATATLTTGKSHTIPSIELTVEHFDNEFAILDAHYTHKRDKALNTSSKWYNKKNADAYYAYKG